ncbi:Hypothetical predicted protein [Olea europaea subsp. europaea]|uniref:Secreted protein n=1 Tax=Olea europaea subsp. europaea TaxID=158383 RepID=A0A8S0UCL4_OLEEU|nr:Hypothetical predicted protein [Olea europaea subsp. europaea]
MQNQWRLWSAVWAVWAVVCGVRTVRCGLERTAESSGPASCGGEQQSRRQRQKQKPEEGPTGQPPTQIRGGQWTHLTSLTVSPDCVTAHCHCGEGSEEPTVERAVTVARESRR